MDKVSEFYSKINSRIENPEDYPDSYTLEIISDNRLREKFLEETLEVINAQGPERVRDGEDDIVYESGDALYFLSLMLIDRGLPEQQYVSLLQNPVDKSWDVQNFSRTGRNIDLRYGARNSIKEFSENYIGLLSDKIEKTTGASWEMVLAEL